MADINDLNINIFDPEGVHNAIVARNNFEIRRNMIRQQINACNGNVESVKRVMLAHLNWTIMMNMPANAVLQAGDVQQINRNYSMINNLIIRNDEQLIINEFINLVDGLTQMERKLFLNVLQNL